MSRFKVSLLLVTSLAVSTQGTVVSSLNLLFPNVRVTEVNNQSAPTTAAPLISGIHASLNNYLRIPLPIWGTTGTGAVASTVGAGTPPAPAAAPTQTQTGVLTPARGEAEGGFQQNPSSGSNTGAAQPGASSFLPGAIHDTIHSTIAQLSTLTHWPFGYVTTPRGTATSTLQQSAPPPPTTFPTTTTSTSTAAPLQTTQAQELPPIPMFHPEPSPQLSQPSFQQQSTIIAAQPPLPPLAAVPTYAPSLPERIHNRIYNRVQNTLNYIRLPTLSQLGQPPRRTMITEPPWVTELLGPTLEPPTTRAPSLPERVHNAVNNVLLFVPATLLNFWYQNWGTQHVDSLISRLQISTQRPGSNESAFATIPGNANIFANLTDAEIARLPGIAAFINNNGTLQPAIVHPVVNRTANTVEYQLRSENETTILWTGSLSNDVFLGNKKPAENLMVEEEGEDEDDDQIKKSALNVKLS